MLDLQYPVTIVNSLSTIFLNAIAGMSDFYKFCTGNDGKGSITRMSDECLMKGKSSSLYFGEYQAGMRKFTLARKSLKHGCAKKLH